ncbi:hypothetical protein [Pseudogemmobacter sonorensis]|uniref:hypothetical protein n=1 Tax=Pseudogemmobacter sonorensis TaxID=2989681 RepID=UPI0036C7073C
MPQKLTQAMREVLERWQDDLPPPWRTPLGDVALGFGDMDPGLTLEPWEPVFPARKGKRFPGAPDAAHALRAFDGVEPGKVRAIILGQDPYPEPTSATGRAFEIGAAREWRDLDRMFSASVRAYTQSVLAARLDRPELARSFADWPGLLARIESGEIKVEQHRRLSDRHESEGVLLLNASLTLSRFRRDIDPHQARGHLPLWRPLILATLRHVAALDRPIVFLGFGAAAEALFAEAGLCALPRHLVVNRPHPAFADDFLALPNPFAAANIHLDRLGAPPINW